MRVLDVGAGHDPDPRATDTADLYDLDGIDHQFDIRERWPFDDGVFDVVVMSHVLEHVQDQTDVLREAARVVDGGGYVEATVPVGDDAFADPDHERAWTYATPEIFCSERRTRHWDPSVPLLLVERDVSVWFFEPFEWASGILQLAAKRWPAEAVRRCSSGEITATFRRPER